MSGQQQHRAKAFWWGWIGFLATVVVYAAFGLSDDGIRGAVSGALIFGGLYAFVVAIVALVRGHVTWAMLRSRGIAAGGAVAAFAMLGVGSAVAGPSKADAAAPSVSSSTGCPDWPQCPDASNASASSSSTVSSSSSSSSTSSSTPQSTASSTSTASAKPKPAAATTKAKHAPAKGTALAAVSSLTVKGRAAKTGYGRDAFGQAWFDADRNGCDTRNDILRRDLVNRSMKNWCAVQAGTLTKDPYTGQSIRFIKGGASEIDIDHVVALSDAWQKGAASWPFSKRLALANDPANLLAVDSGANRAKGDGDAATWLPPNKSYRCTYVSRQVTVKKKYGLWVTPAERDAMKRVLSNCDRTALPAQGSAPTSAQPPRTHTPAPRPTTTTKPPVPKPAPAPRTTVPKALAPPAYVYYKNCDAVRAAGAAPIHVGDPGYSRKLDRDGDGIGCE